MTFGNISPKAVSSHRLVVIMYHSFIQVSSWGGAFFAFGVKTLRGGSLNSMKLADFNLGGA